MRSLSNLVLVGCETKLICHDDAPHHQHLIFLANFPNDVRHQSTIIGGDPTRLQRATKGADQSAGGRSDEVINRCCMRFVFRHVDAIMLGDFGVGTKRNGLITGGQISESLWTANALDANT